MESKTGNDIYPLAMTAVMTAVMAAVSPFTVAIGPIPLSFCTLVIYLAAYILGWRRAAAATLVYILMGAVGVPVFSGFGAGLGKVAGPTGGYIVGYIFLAAISGLAVQRFPNRRLPQFAGMAAATAVLYAFGTAWFCLQSGTAPGPALAMCVLPFIPGDLAKMAAAMGLGPAIRSGLWKAGIHRMG